MITRPFDKFVCHIIHDLNFLSTRLLNAWFPIGDTARGKETIFTSHDKLNIRKILFEEFQDSGIRWMPDGLAGGYGLSGGASDIVIICGSENLEVGFPHTRIAKDYISEIVNQCHYAEICCVVRDLARGCG